MEQFNTAEDGSLSGLINGTHWSGIYPKHRFWQDVQDMVTNGEAEIVPYEAPDLRPSEERSWRDQELARSDIELYKIQDGGVGTVGTWRTYRVALRDLPNHVDFPLSTARPSAPDA
jgi:hypothetical protein